MKLGIVLTGGGARGAYQVGVLRAIYEISHKHRHLLDVITGNSAGAINATYIASNANDWDVATKSLIEMWKNLSPHEVFDLSKRSITGLGFKWVTGTVFGGMTKSGSNMNHLLDTEPLRNLLKDRIDFIKLNKNILDGVVEGVALSTTNYSSGSSVVFYNAHTKIEDWSRSDRFSHRTAIGIDHLMGSAAIPFFFPPEKIGESYFGDGCVRQTTPFSPAIHLGADKIIGIGIRHPHPREKMMQLAFAPVGEPTIGQIAGVMLNAIFLDSMEADYERMKRINELIAKQDKPEFKQIPVYMIRPSQDLGKMTEKLNRELPGKLRYLLKGIGVSDKEGLDLLSYLAFDNSYTEPLIELGYQDTLNQRDLIIDFITS